MHIYIKKFLINHFRARIHQPDTLRALYGLTDTRNSFHGSGKKKIRKKHLRVIIYNIS